MKITMKTLYATPERSIAAGATADLPDKEAKDLVDKGYAVRADSDPAEGQKPDRRARQSSPADPDAVPAGNVQAVLTWVDNDPERAARALEAEQAKGDKARSGLVADLEQIVGGAGE